VTLNTIVTNGAGDASHLATWFSITSNVFLIITFVAAAASAALIMAARATSQDVRPLLALYCVVIWFGALAANVYSGFDHPPGYLIAIIFVTICVISLGQSLILLLTVTDHSIGSEFSKATVRLIRRASGVTLAIIGFRALSQGTVMEEVFDNEQGILYNLLDIFSNDSEHQAGSILLLFSFFLVPYIWSRWFLTRAARLAGVNVPRYANLIPIGVAAVLLGAIGTASMLSDGQKDWKDVVEEYFGSFFALGLTAALLSALSFDWLWDKSAGLLGIVGRYLRHRT
jgi:hypothetical protein